MTLHDIQDDSWYPETGASAHMNVDFGKLHTLSNYFGSEKIIAGNGEALNITHIGSTDLKVVNNRLKLNNILVVPEIKKKLLSS